MGSAMMARGLGLGRLVGGLKRTNAFFTFYKLCINKIRIKYFNQFGWEDRATSGSAPANIRRWYRSFRYSFFHHAWRRIFRTKSPDFTKKIKVVKKPNAYLEYVKMQQKAIIDPKAEPGGT